METEMRQRVANELKLPAKGVGAVLALLEQSNTVPFIARYRKEATGGLDEVQIREIAALRTSHLALEQRRATIEAAIDSQGALTPELRRRLAQASTRAELEDLYLPYKRKRRTRAQVARERGLEALAKRILAQPEGGNPQVEARAFITDDVPDASAALAGARDIVAEVIAESASARRELRDRYRREAVIISKPARGKSKAKSKFEQYKDFREPIARIPSHRYLAIIRGESDGFLSARIGVDPDRAEADLARSVGLARRSPWARELGDAIVDSYKRLLGPSLETEFRAALKERSDKAAATVFADNVGNLLLAAPLGGKPVIGIDPGLRTGCKCAVLDATGKFVANATLYLSSGESAKTKARRELADLLARHKPEAIAIGNGTGGRETEAFVRAVVAESATDSPTDEGCVVVSVSESGASIYSASDIAREEFPELDLTIRGAISIGRRLQDPLAELVKVDPKSIGVGQYQHDVNQTLLGEKLTEVVESCVNRVGVELNTASAALLSYVSGIAKSLAKKIVAHREKHGAFATRTQLLSVSGLGARAFEQAAGFLRIREGQHPLDASSVHPERYELVATMAGDIGVSLDSLVGNPGAAARIEIARYVGPDVGEPTLKDIVEELKKPGRDPRQRFEPPAFRDGVSELADLEINMQLEGVVTNVTAFGAFVDVGVHQDGLVHISELADEFVKDPNDIVRVGDKIRVRVLSIDAERKRISLTAKKHSPGPHAVPAPTRQPAAKRKTAKPSKSKPSANKAFSNNPFSNLKKV